MNMILLGLATNLPASLAIVSAASSVALIISRTLNSVDKHRSITLVHTYVHTMMMTQLELS